MLIHKDCVFVTSFTLGCKKTLIVLSQRSHIPKRPVMRLEWSICGRAALNIVTFPHTDSVV